MKDVIGFEGYYKVSRDGKIWSRISDKYLSPGIASGYAHVQLRGNGKRVQDKVHRLVAQAYIPNPENKEQVNHKDCDKLNNHVDNLEWATRSENMLHAHRNGLIKEENKYRGGKPGRPVYELDADTGNIIHEYDSLNDVSKKYGIHSKVLYMSILRNGMSYGKKFIYKENHYNENKKVCVQ